MQGKLFAIAYSATGQREDALDLVQHAMTQLVIHYRQRPAEQWPPLLMRILGNAITDYYRRNARHREYIDSSSDWSELPEQRLHSQTRSPNDDPAALADTAALNTAISTAVAGLPDRQRQAFLLRGWGELSVAECAASMTCSAGSVKQHYFRALRALRPLLGAVELAVVPSLDCRSDCNE